jgi:transposase-like protein
MPAPKPTPERQQAIAYGLKVYEESGNLALAERMSGVPDSTLQDWWRKLRGGDPGALQTAEEAIAGRMAELALKAADQLAEALERDDLKPRDLVPIAGMATDKLARYRGWGTPQDTTDATNNVVSQALATIAKSGGKVTVSVEADTPAIDVTPTTDET